MLEKCFYSCTAQAVWRNGWGWSAAYLLWSLEILKTPEETHHIRTENCLLTIFSASKVKKMRAIGLMEELSSTRSTYRKVKKSELVERRGPINCSRDEKASSGE